MIDIRFLRENPEAVKENIRKKFQDAKLPLVDEVVDLAAKRRLREGYLHRRIEVVALACEPAVGHHFREDEEIAGRTAVDPRLALA